MKVIYIAGKYRASTENGVYENIQHAREAAIRLWKQGYAVICPHLNTAFFGGSCPDDTWLKGDLEILGRCDAIYMLKGWQESEGATTEFIVANERNLKVMYEQEED